MTPNLARISEIIRNRRSIYPPAYTGEKIPDETVMEFLENANWAPNHKKTEPWRFHVITGDALSRLKAYAQEHYKQTKQGDAFNQMKFERLGQKFDTSSHVIAICMQRDPQERVPEWEEVAALSCAVQNLWLSVSAAGYGGYWSSGGYTLSAGDFLGLAEGQRSLGFFFLGVPKPDVPLFPKRGAVEEKVTWHR